MAKLCVERDCNELAVLPAKTPCRCVNHERDRERARGTPTERGYDAQHERDSREIREAWVAENGLMCPGYGIPAHPVNSISDLHADHLVAGHPEHGYQVQCGLAGFGCNMRRANHSARKGL